MEPGGSLSCSQEPATRPYPEAHRTVHTLLPYFLKIRFNIILPSTPKSS
jgi:hypothetical protein